MQTVVSHDPKYQLVYQSPNPDPPKGGPGGSAGILIPNLKGVDRYLDLDHIRMLRDKAKNVTREEHVKRTLAAASGVYNNKARGLAAGLAKTVFMTVIAFHSNQKSIGHYKIYFRNFVCFAKHYDIDLIAYILQHNLPDVEAEITSMEQLGLRVLTYPDELFWNIVLQKKSKVMEGKAFADYKGDIPSFVGYGALAMLVPQLEALMFGYNVVYFDVDIGLVLDPVPYMMRGDADFVVSIEQRACPEEYPSSTKWAQDWENMEPNTGVMLVRATPQGVAMYQHWLKRIVKTNVMNDQIVFDRSPLLPLSFYSRLTCIDPFTLACSLCILPTPTCTLSLKLPLSPYPPITQPPYLPIITETVGCCKSMYKMTENSCMLRPISLPPSLPTAIGIIPIPPPPSG